MKRTQCFLKDCTVPSRRAGQQDRFPPACGILPRQISDLLFELNENNQTTLVLVTHDQGLAQRCRQVIQLEAGAIVEAASA